jgi:hypothetical protein
MKKKILYIPIDDRPVCTKRVQYLAEATGFDLLMPPVDDIKTCLDYQPKNNTGLPYGDVEKIWDWFCNQNHQEIEYYILSIDQMVSGGLVQSRHDVTLSFEESQRRLRRYLDSDALKKKKVIFIDSLVRLATTCEYAGCDIHVYNGTREYGSIPRKRIETNSIEDIESTYEYDVDEKYLEPEDFGLNIEVIKKYLHNRARKLALTSDLMDQLTHANFKYYYMLGIDDSIPHDTIQTNEIEYFKKKMKNLNGIVFCGIDELPLMSLCKITQREYDKDFCKVDLIYVGGGENKPGDEFDTGTIAETVDNHLIAMGLEKGTPQESKVHVVMLTYRKDEDGTQKSSIDETVSIVNSLIQSQQMVILMDLSNCTRFGEFEKELIERIPFCQLLAYSNWNTIANAVGISLSQGMARYYYLHQLAKIDEEGNKAFLKLLTYSLLKDITYKIFAKPILTKQILSQTGNKKIGENFYLDVQKLNNLDEITTKTMESKETPCSVPLILSEMKNQFYVVAIGSGTVSYEQVPNVMVHTYTYPWHRLFELDMKIEVKEVKYENN